MTSLRTDPLYVDPTGAPPVDATAVRRTLRDSPVPVYVALLPQAAADAAGGLDRLVLQLGQGVGDTQAVVLAGTDKGSFRADNGRGAGARGVNAGLALREALASTRGRALDAAGVSALITDLVARVNNQATSRSGGGQPATQPASSSAGGILLPLLVIVALGCGGALLFGLSRRRRRERERQRANEEARAEVESLYGRLGSDVSTLAPGNDDVARQAMVDAAERYNATGALLSKADTPGEFAAARQTAVEGLVAARTARARLGLDPGPEIPLPPGSGPQLENRQRVQVGDQEYEGSPQYEPGRGHYFGGGMLNGRMVPGGWYGFPFWETMLMTSVLTGGFGGGFGFGGGGYERGYEAGAESAQGAGDGGGDRGAGWAGGGGDWGDFGGGDDFGGGGDGGGW